MERSPIPLHKWLVGAFLMIRGKGVSSLQLARDLGITQKSAWFMGHRLRYAMKSDGGMFAGTVEVDEVYLGGKNKNRHKARKLPGRGSSGKTPVVGIKDRESNRFFAAPVASVNRETVEDLIGEHIAGGSNAYTDQSSVYNHVECHQSVNHSHGKNVRDRTHRRSRSTGRRLPCGGCT